MVTIRPLQPAVYRVGFVKYNIAAAGRAAQTSWGVVVKSLVPAGQPRHRDQRRPGGCWRDEDDMAEMGDGYGSECHLLRYLGRHRDCFNDMVRSTIGADAVRWLDFHFDPTKRWPDGERKGIDFLRADDPASLAWSRVRLNRNDPHV
jgi:hypothetical protein